MRHFLGFLLAMTLLTLTGCGFGSPVTGKVVQNGKPITGANPGDTIQILFVQSDGAKKAFPSAVDPADWSFKTLSRLPAGKYNVRVSWIEDYNKVLEKNPKADISAIPDKFKDEFAGDKSPLTVEITGDTKLIIDVATKKVTKE